MHKIKNKKKTTKFDAKRNYSDFWMDQGTYGGSLFSGIDGIRSSSDTVRLIKLNTYRKAIANFVNILTGKNIPVTFQGNQSYTDGKSVTISADIKDKNFDVSVGLALHEASHIVLTDFKYLEEMYNKFGNDSIQHWDLWKNLLNWIEDRRIDNFIFKTSPGYKAYYHKMYDYYWHSDAIAKGLLSAEYRDPREENSWLFRIINSINPESDRSALPQLGEILDIIDVPNISRLKSVQEAGEVTTKVFDIVVSYLDGTAEDQKPTPGQGDPKDSEDSEGNSTPPELSASDAIDVQKALSKQKNFLDDKNKKDKKTLDRKLQKKMDKLEESDVEMQPVAPGTAYSTNVLVYNMAGRSEIINKYKTLQAKYADLRKTTPAGTRNPAADEFREYIEGVMPEGFSMRAETNKDYVAAISKGYDMGGLLGKKLQVRNEARELVYTRMRTGGLDNKRLAQAGYGVESIFKQIHIDKFKQANLHISIDGSGSMAGDKWEGCAMMTMAIARAASYVQNLRVQVTLRVTETSGKLSVPVLVWCYDSKINKVGHLRNVLEAFTPNSYTPEGLCFEALLARNEIVRTSTEVDSYFLNISDGEPSGIRGYEGQAALDHTKKQIDKMRKEHNVGILGFYIVNGTTNKEHRESIKAKMTELGGDRTWTRFKHMYSTKDSAFVFPDDMIGIAKEMNRTFLRKAVA